MCELCEYLAGGSEWCDESALELGWEGCLGVDAFGLFRVEGTGAGLSPGFEPRLEDGWFGVSSEAALASDSSLPTESDGGLGRIGGGLLAGDLVMAGCGGKLFKSGCEVLEFAFVFVFVLAFFFVDRR